MSTAKRSLSKKPPKKSPQVAAVDDPETLVDHDKSKVECICPKCGKKHVMNFHWIGRGTPRKYCQSCRDSI
jgi:hypothetical protein